MLLSPMIRWGSVYWRKGHLHAGGQGPLARRPMLLHAKARSHSRPAEVGRRGRAAKLPF